MIKNRPLSILIFIILGVLLFIGKDFYFLIPRDIGPLYEFTKTNYELEDKITLINDHDYTNSELIHLINSDKLASARMIVINWCVDNIEQENLINYCIQNSNYALIRKKSSSTLRFKTDSNTFEYRIASELFPEKIKSLNNRGTNSEYINYNLDFQRLNINHLII